MLFETIHRFPPLSIALISRHVAQMSQGLAHKFQEYVDKRQEFNTVNAMIAVRYFSLKDFAVEYITPPISAAFHFMQLSQYLYEKIVDRYGDDMNVSKE